MNTLQDAVNLSNRLLKIYYDLKFPNDPFKVKTRKLLKTKSVYISSISCGKNNYKASLIMDEFKTLNFENMVDYNLLLNERKLIINKIKKDQQRIIKIFLMKKFIPDIYNIINFYIK